MVQGSESTADWYKVGTDFITQGKALYPDTRRAKNVFLFVGDGMGLSTQTAARIQEGQTKSKPGGESRLAFETLPCSDLPQTCSCDQQTSDSAPR